MSDRDFDVRSGFLKTWSENMFSDQVLSTDRVFQKPDLTCHVRSGRQMVKKNVWNVGKNEKKWKKTHFAHLTDRSCTSDTRVKSALIYYK